MSAAATATRPAPRYTYRSVREARSDLSRITQFFFGGEGVETSITQDTQNKIQQALEKHDQQALQQGPGESSSDADPSWGDLAEVVMQRVFRDPVLVWAVDWVRSLLPLLIAGAIHWQREVRSLTLDSNGLIPPIPPSQDVRIQLTGPADTTAYSFLVTAATTWLACEGLSYLFNNYDYLRNRFRPWVASLNVVLRAALCTAALWVLNTFCRENTINADMLGQSFALSVTLGAFGATLFAGFRSGLVYPRVAPDNLRWLDHGLKMGYPALCLMLLRFVGASSEWCGSLLIGENGLETAYLPIFHRYAEIFLPSTLALGSAALLYSLYRIVYEIKNWEEREAVQAFEIPELSERSVLQTSRAEAELRIVLIEGPLLRDFSWSAQNYKDLQKLREQCLRQDSRLRAFLESDTCREWGRLFTVTMATAILYGVSRSVLGELIQYETTQESSCVDAAQTECEPGSHYRQCLALLRSPDRGLHQILSVLVLKFLGWRFFQCIRDIAYRVREQHGFLGSALAAMVSGAGFGILAGTMGAAWIPGSAVETGVGGVVGFAAGTVVGLLTSIAVHYCGLPMTQFERTRSDFSLWQVGAVVASLMVIRLNIPMTTSVIAIEHSLLEQTLQMRQDGVIPLTAQTFFWIFGVATLARGLGPLFTWTCESKSEKSSWGDGGRGDHEYAALFHGRGVVEQQRARPTQRARPGYTALRDRIDTGAVELDPEYEAVAGADEEDDDPHYARAGSAAEGSLHTYEEPSVLHLAGRDSPRETGTEGTGTHPVYDNVQRLREQGSVGHVQEASNS